MPNLAALVKLAHDHPEHRADLLAVIRKMALDEFTVFPTDAANFTPDVQRIGRAKVMGKALVLWLAALLGKMTTPTGTTTAEKLLLVATKAKLLAAMMKDWPPEQTTEVLTFLKDYAYKRHQIKFPTV